MLDVLWDTSAAVSLIDTKTVRDLKLKTIGTERIRTLTGLVEAQVKVTKQVTTMLIFQDGRKCKITALVMEKQAPCELIIGIDFITKEGLSFTPKGEELEIWDEKWKKQEKIYTTKGKKLLRKHGEQKKILSFKAKVRNKSVHKVEEYMSKVSKEDKDFLHLLTHLKVKNTEESTWVNIIQCMEGRYSTSTGSAGTVPSSEDAAAQDTMPPTQGTMPGRETSGRNSVSSAVAGTMPWKRDVTPSETNNNTMPSQEGTAPSQGGTTPSGEDVVVQVHSESPQPGEAVLNNQVRLKAPRCDFPEFQERLDKLVSRFPAVFAVSGSDVGKLKGEEVKLVLKNDNLVNLRNYQTPLKLQDIMKGCIDELLEAGVIEKCTKSQYNSPCLLVPKKMEAGKDAGHWLVIDYRKLNDILETVVYPMPRIQDILCKYQGCDVFSVVDICHAYYMIKLDKGSRHVTAFSCEAGQ